MPEEFKAGCSRPTGGLVGEEVKEISLSSESSNIKEEKTMLQVGQKAPDFTAPAFYEGKFVELKLSEYLGKWVVLCFYPGDFTFV